MSGAGFRLYGTTFQLVIAGLVPATPIIGHVRFLKFETSVPCYLGGRDKPGHDAHLNLKCTNLNRPPIRVPALTHAPRLIWVPPRAWHAAPPSPPRPRRTSRNR